MANGFNAREVNELALDFTKAPGRAQRRTPKVFARTALETKRRIQKDATGHDYLRSLQRHVGYDRIGELSYEIGFDKEGQLSLIHI